MANLDNRMYPEDGKQDSDNEDKLCPKDSNLMGIRGWLIVLLVCICLGILLTIFNLLSVISLLYSWIYFAFILLNIFVLITMIKKLYFFPKLYMILVASLIIYTLLISFQEPTFNYFNLGSLIGTIVWIVYIDKSKRVKCTFIYNWKGQEVRKTSKLL